MNAPLRNKQRELRAKKSELKRLAHGDAITGKLKIVPPPASLSGKRKRKLLKKWRQDQRAAMEKGLVTMEDIQMMSIDNDDEDLQKSTLDSSAKGGSMKLQIKKRAKLRIRKGKGKGKNRGKANAKGDPSSHADTMVEWLQARPYVEGPDFKGQMHLGANFVM